MNTTASTRLLVAVTVIGAAFGTIAVYMNLKPVFAQDGGDSAEMVASIIALHEQKITMLERVLEEAKQRRRKGPGSKSDVIAAELALAEVHIDIAVLQDRRGTIVEQLHVILGLHEEHLDLVRREFNAGVRNRDDLLELELAVIDTRIRILQAEANDV